jgi:hypothetical protein
MRSTIRTAQERRCHQFILVTRTLLVTRIPLQFQRCHQCHQCHQSRAHAMASGAIPDGALSGEM